MEPHERVHRTFLDRQWQEATRLAAESDLLDVYPVAGSPPWRFVAAFSCNGLIRTASGDIQLASRFEVGITLPPSYLRQVEPAEVMTWLGPPEIFHPNVTYRGPLICIGYIRPATPVLDLIYRTWEVISYRSFGMNELDALNAAACQYARHHQDRFPVDDRPLKRRAGRLHAEVIERTDET
jgi:hypothetical protein